MCSSLPAPPLATTGTPTVSLTRRVISRSKPAFVPSASMLFSTISPAPSATASRAQATASSPVGLRPPCEKTSHRSGATFLASIETTMHWLPNCSAPWRIRSGIGKRGGIDARLVRARLQHRVHVLDRADAAADGQRHETLIRGPLDHIDHRGPSMRAGGDIEENHFIRALLVIAEGQFDGVADVAQFAGLGPAELHAAGNFAVMDIEAGNDTFGQHINNARTVAEGRTKSNPKKKANLAVQRPTVPIIGLKNWLASGQSVTRPAAPSY